ncbi:hypothetical protein QUB47_34895, partial [Microcoleus sp. AT9_B5]
MLIDKCFPSLTCQQCVWPDPQGVVRGQAIAPLYRSVPQAASNDPELYALLSLIDAIRVGRVREQRLAASELE